MSLSLAFHHFRFIRSASTEKPGHGNYVNASRSSSVVSCPTGPWRPVKSRPFTLERSLAGCRAVKFTRVLPLHRHPRHQPPSYTPSIGDTSAQQLENPATTARPLTNRSLNTTTSPEQRTSTPRPSLLRTPSGREASISTKISTNPPLCPEPVIHPMTDDPPPTPGPPNPPPPPDRSPDPPAPQRNSGRFPRSSPIISSTWAGGTFSWLRLVRMLNWASGGEFT